MLDDAPLAMSLHRPVRVQGDPRAVLDVQLLQASTGSCNGAHPGVANHLAPAYAYLPQLGAVDREHLEAGVGEVALADVDRPQPRSAAPRQLLDGRVADVGAAAHVEVAQLVAVPRDRRHPDVGDPMTLGSGEVAEGGPESGELEEGGVGDGRAVGDGELAQLVAVGGDQLDALVRDGGAAAEVEEEKLCGNLTIRKIKSHS